MKPLVTNTHFIVIFRIIAYYTLKPCLHHRKKTSTLCSFIWTQFGLGNVPFCEFANLYLYILEETHVWIHCTYVLGYLKILSWQHKSLCKALEERCTFFWSQFLHAKFGEVDTGKSRASDRDDLKCLQYSWVSPGTQSSSSLPIESIQDSSRDWLALMRWEHRYSLNRSRFFEFIIPMKGSWSSYSLFLAELVITEIFWLFGHLFEETFPKVK